jgi:hypothetical protein
MTVQEIIDKLKEFYITPESIYGEEEPYILESAEYDLGEIETIERIGGYEGSGEHFHIVIYLPKFDIYLRADGEYQSYRGVEFYDNYWYEVKKQIKTITVYE